MLVEPRYEKSLPLNQSLYYLEICRHLVLFLRNEKQAEVISRGTKYVFSLVRVYLMGYHCISLKVIVIFIIVVVVFSQ